MLWCGHFQNEDNLFPFMQCSLIIVNDLFVFLGKKKFPLQHLLVAIHLFIQGK